MVYRDLTKQEGIWLIQENMPHISTAKIVDPVDIVSGGKFIGKIYMTAGK